MAILKNGLIAFGLSLLLFLSVVSLAKITSASDAKEFIAQTRSIADRIDKIIVSIDKLDEAYSSLDRDQIRILIEESKALHAHVQRLENGR